MTFYSYSNDEENVKVNDLRNKLCSRNKYIIIINFKFKYVTWWKYILIQWYVVHSRLFLINTAIPLSTLFIKRLATNTEVNDRQIFTSHSFIFIKFVIFATKLRWSLISIRSRRRKNFPDSVYHLRRVWFYLLKTYYKHLLEFGIVYITSERLLHETIHQNGWAFPFDGSILKSGHFYRV